MTGEVLRFVGTVTARSGDLRNCPGKIRFATQETADLRARQINALTGDDMHSYRCTACDWIHLGHPTGTTGIRHGVRRQTAEPPALIHDRAA